MANFILLTQGTGGDLHPFIQISLELLRRGHSVTLYAETRFGEKIGRYGIDFVPIDAQLTPEQKTQTAAAHSLAPEGGISPLIWTTCTNIFESIRQRNVPGRTTIVSNYNINLACQTIAEALDTSFVEVYLAPYFVMRMEVVQGMYTLDTALFNHYRAQMSLPPVHDWRAWLRKHPRKLGVWPEWFAPNEPNWIFKIMPVGFVWNVDFVTGELPQDVREFLSEGELPVLITHGTSEPSRPGFFEASAEACRLLGRRGMIVGKYEGLVPADLPPEVKWFEYAPFVSLLPHTSAIIHHGGIATISHAFATGVPQLILGYGFDRPDNGMRIQRLGAGGYLPPVRWRGALVADALRRATTPQVRQRCRELAKLMKDTANPAEVACDVILNNDFAHVSAA